MALLRTFMHFRAFKYTFMTFLSGFSEIIKDGADLARGEILAMGVVACSCKLLSELGNAVDPTHQVACGGARVAVGEIEHCKLLFAVTVDFHFYQKLKVKNIFTIISYFSKITFSKITPSLFTIKEGSTSHPDPLALRGEGETAPPPRSEPLRSKVVGGIKAPRLVFDAIELRLFVRCYTALLKACLGMQGVTLRDSRHDAERYDFFYGS